MSKTNLLLEMQGVKHFPACVRCMTSIWMCAPVKYMVWLAKTVQVNPL